MLSEAASGLFAASRCLCFQVSPTSCQVGFSSQETYNLSQIPRTRKSLPPDAANWMISNMVRARLRFIDSRYCQSKSDPSSAVRRQVKLAVRGKRDRENLVRLTFLLLFSLLDEHIPQRELLTAGTGTFQDEEPQVSTEKARSYHHSKLLVFSEVATLKFWLKFLQPHTLDLALYVKTL